MKTVEFLKASHDTYMCQCVGDEAECPIDHAGTYVLASEAEERERVLRKALEEIERLYGELERLSVKYKESEAYYHEQIEILQNELNYYCDLIGFGRP